MRKLADCKNFFKDLCMDCLDVDATGKSIFDSVEKARYEMYCETLQFIYGQEFDAVRPYWAQDTLNEYYAGIEEAEKPCSERTPKRQEANIRTARMYTRYRVAKAVHESCYDKTDKGKMLNIVNTECDKDAIRLYWDTDTAVREELQGIIERTLRSMRHDTHTDAAPSAGAVREPGKKLVVVMNGSGTTGKDTLCRYMAEVRAANAVWNVSAIDPVLEPAMAAGWDGRKTIEGRRLLSDLKDAMIRYDDGPVRYLIDKYHKFAESGGRDPVRAYPRAGGDR